MAAKHRKRSAQTLKEEDRSAGERVPTANETLAAVIERELDEALEATFPASDPIAVPSVAVFKARRRHTKQQHRS